MNSKNIFLTTLILIAFFSLAVSANAAELPSAGTTPDSPLYIFKTWKESIQTFFTFGLENKARQYLHLAEVRLAEYQKMIDKGKTKIAEKTLTKYEKQLNRALEKAETMKQKGKETKDLTQNLEQTVSKHLDVLEKNLEKSPEAAKKGLEKAIESSGKAIERIKEKLKEPKDETAGWKTYRSEEFGFEVKYPEDWRRDESYGPTEMPQLFYTPDQSREIVSKLEIYVDKGPRFSLDSYLNPPDKFGISELLESKNVSIDGVDGVQKIEKLVNGIADLVIVQNQDSIYTITLFMSEDKRGKYEEIFNQILSTFRFISQ